MGLFGRRKEKQDGSECARCKGQFPETTYVQKHGHLCTECFGALVLEMSQKDEGLAVSEPPTAAKPGHPEDHSLHIEGDEITLVSSNNETNEEKPQFIPEKAQEGFHLGREEGAEEENCSRLMTRDVVWVKGSDEVKKARRVMMEKGFSQLPVFNDELLPSQLLGVLTDKNICDHRHDLMELKVDRIMDCPPPTVSPTMGVRAIQELLNHGAGCVIVRDRDSILGIITRENLM